MYTSLGLYTAASRIRPCDPDLSSLADDQDLRVSLRCFVCFLHCWHPLSTCLATALAATCGRLCVRQTNPIPLWCPGAVLKLLCTDNPRPPYSVYGQCIAQAGLSGTPSMVHIPSLTRLRLCRMTGVRHEFVPHNPNPYGANKSECTRCKKKTEDETGSLYTYLPGSSAPAEVKQDAVRCKACGHMKHMGGHAVQF